MEDHIRGLVNSILVGRKYGKPDFTADLPETFVCSNMDPYKEWERYVEYRKSLDLRHARNRFLWEHYSIQKLEDDLMEAYYTASQEKKKFAKK